MKLGLLTEPPDRPSALSAGSETRAEHRTRGEHTHDARFAGRRLEDIGAIPSYISYHTVCFNFASILDRAATRFGCRPAARSISVRSDGHPTFKPSAPLAR